MAFGEEEVKTRVWMEGHVHVYGQRANWSKEGSSLSWKHSRRKVDAPTLVVRYLYIGQAFGALKSPALQARVRQGGHGLD